MKVVLYIKNGDSILSEKGKEILDCLKEPLEQIYKIVYKENKVIGVDENLIEDNVYNTGNTEYKYMNSKELIRQYNLGLLNKIILSSDHEEDIDFESKVFIGDKKVILNYGGPTPPDMDHEYTLIVYAHKDKLKLKQGFYYNELKSQLENNEVIQTKIKILAKK